MLVISETYREAKVQIMKRITLKLIAVFQIISGLGGLALVAGGIVGMLPDAVVPVLWFGLFPLVSVITGVQLWLRWKYAVWPSILVQLLQVPIIYTGGSLLNLGLALKLTISATWNARDGGYPTVLGINLLALGLLIGLLWCRSDLPDVAVTDNPSDRAFESTAS
jgi:hypothetical protein